MPQDAIFVSAVVSVIVLVAGKAFDRWIAKDRDVATAVGRTEDHLWSRVTQLEADRDRIAQERDHCRGELAEIRGELSEVSARADAMSHHVEHLEALSMKHGQAED